MDRPFSYRTPFWSVFEQGQDSIIQDKFIEGKEVRLSISHKTPDSNIVIQNTPIASKNSYLNNKQAECWFRIFGKRTVGLLSKADTFKFHYDHGITDMSGVKMNFYGGFQCRRNFEDRALKIGAIYISDQFIFDNRFKAPTLWKNQSIRQFSFKNWKVQLMKMIDLSNFRLLGNSLRICYKMKEGNEFFFNAENTEHRNIHRINYSKFYSYFSSRYIKKIDEDLKMGIEVAINNKRQVQKRGRFVIEKRNAEKESVTKLRIGTDKSLAFFMQRVLKNYGDYGFSIQYKRQENKNTINCGMCVNINL